MARRKTGNKFNPRIFLRLVEEVERDYLVEKSFINKELQFNVGHGPVFKLFPDISVWECSWWDRVRALSTKLRPFVLEESPYYVYRTCKISTYIKDIFETGRHQYRNDLKVLGKSVENFLKSTSYSFIKVDKSGKTDTGNKKQITKKDLLNIFFNGSFFHIDEDKMGVLDNTLKIAGDFELRGLIFALEKLTILIFEFSKLIKKMIENGDIDLKIETYKKIRTEDKIKAYEYFNKGNVSIKMLEYDKAIEHYNMAIDLNPNYAGAYNNRAISYEAFGEYGKAIDDFEIAISLIPYDENIYLNCGGSYFSKGNDYKAKGNNNEAKIYYDKAIEYFNKAIDINPNFGEAYFMRASVYIKIEKYDKALSDCEMALSLKTNLQKEIEKLKSDIKQKRGMKK